MISLGHTDAEVQRADENAVTPRVDAKLCAVLKRLTARRAVQHASLALASGEGTRSWAGASGPADESGAPMGPQTPFFIASVTKIFIATLLLQATERREVELNAPLTHYLPVEVTEGLHLYRGKDYSSQITVGNLATHTSGLPDYFEKRRDARSLYDYLASGEDIGWDFTQVLKITKEQQHPHFAPQDLEAKRQKARYSDTGFQLLIRVLEEATGQSYADLLRQRITGPLGLKKTQLPGAVPDAQCAQLSRRGQWVRLPELIRSSHDLISTPEELITFQRALLGGELFNDPATSGLLTQWRNRLRNIPILSYGLGTMYFRELIGHSGATGTWLFYSPKRDLYLAGTVDITSGQSLPFRLFPTLVRAWG
ncbi:serine hydrolase [Auritidibacter ignavus]|uniref:serine hydrolase domain-containing protein n=1 Tax=Auritidibacter ignavus TaxID=678932 RepID=UPI0024487E23|nr:serine hydrolase domain-containing protein [Auritidibacter ignavus]WGH81112.1 serine hydrolase [Auritidibacter ignavus]WHS35868.1 serine hydrolase domain-containing protein [Auritidibacter ignavus]